ncbi:hypothetical protein J1N35_021771 [Gossypium stocksii]|uniref:Endonuclease/exonuclease/phosphatase domain-containing protein n=1 Tax=Gossypium stocksii TaxID=47602 RepID=A0A9D3VEU7_9ROSI|nr:hypothetical protein J1N35_021771 [Gossypium stocksii]
MNEFRTTLEDCGLNDLGYIGGWFTWERGRFLATNIRERLDRGVASLNWMSIHQCYQLEHLSHFFSDHCPILLDTKGKKMSNFCNKNKIFRFEAKWCLKNSFDEEIKRFWTNSAGNVPERFEQLGQQIQRWEKARSRKQKKNRVDLEERLNSLSNQDPTDEILAEIVDVQLGLNLKTDQEEIFWEQRPHTNWLKNGDKNISYFHNVAVQWHFHSRIKGLEGENGTRVIETEEMLKLASNFLVVSFQLQKWVQTSIYLSQLKEKLLQI